jgi:hypothetical protein
LIQAQSQLITNWVERDELVKGYQEAKALVERHPEKADAHFALSYVLRYGGALEESGRECDAALALDSGNYSFRSCAFTFDQLGNYAHAMDFVRLDAGSKWSNGNLARHLIRDGKIEEAKAIAEKTEDKPMLSCLSGIPTPVIWRKTAEDVMKDPDAEVHYILASDFLYCGQRDSALQLLRSAVAAHFCAYTGLQNDSTWAKLRGTPEFDQLVSSAKQCRDDFLAKRSQPAN